MEKKLRVSALGQTKLHPFPSSVLGAGGAANQAAREDSEKSCKYFLPSQEGFKYLRFFVSQFLEILLEL